METPESETSGSQAWAANARHRNQLSRTMLCMERKRFPFLTSSDPRRIPTRDCKCPFNPRILNRGRAPLFSMERVNLRQ
jgi:hypothetical protein